MIISRRNRSPILLGAVILGVVILAGGTAGFSYYRNRINKGFESVYEATVLANGRAFLVGHESLVNDGPQRVLQSNGNGRWKQLSGTFYSNVRALEKFYAPIAVCLNNGSCWPRDQDGPFCDKAAHETLAYQEIKRRLGLIEGISINETDDPDELADASGSSFQLAPINDLKAIIEHACSKKLDSLAQEMAAERPERIAAARTAWQQIRTRESVLEMRDFPVSFDVALEAISKSEFEQAVRQASEATEKKIRAQLCQQQRDIEGLPEDFGSEEKTLSKYFLNPTCRLERDGSRKCTWANFYSKTNKLILGQDVAPAEETTQTSFLGDMMEECVPSSCQLKTETPRSGQNAWGFTCSGLDREYKCRSGFSPLVVSLMTCFNVSSLQIITPVPKGPPIPEEESVVTPDIKEVDDGYRQCRGKISLRGCLAQIHAVLCGNSQDGAAKANCESDILAKLTSLSSQCLKSAFDDFSGKWTTGDSWGIGTRGTDVDLSSVPKLENALILQFHATEGSDINFGRLLASSSGSRGYVIVDGKRFGHSVEAGDLLKALLVGNNVQIPHLDYSDRYETVSLSTFRVLYGQMSAIYKGCGFWEGRQH